MSNPVDFTYEDQEMYKELMNQTELRTHPHPGKGRPRATIKWKLLKDLEERRDGDGIFLPGDIKGLTTKLHLLLAEFHAGNTSTRNEIVFILDELLRRKQISKIEYRDINNYISDDCNCSETPKTT